MDEEGEGNTLTAFPQADGRGRGGKCSEILIQILKNVTPEFSKT
jgi:hypothetical protein